MLKIEAKVKDGSVSVRRKIDGCSKDIFDEGIAVIRSVIDLYAKALRESEADVLRATVTLLLEDIEKESALEDKEGAELC